MGSRGAFADVNAGDFTFVDGGQTFNSIGKVDGVKVLVRTDGYSVKAPEYSHTAKRTYAVIQDGKLKHLTFYDENHNQYVSIDLLHEHGSKRLKPHKHLYLDHTDDGIPISDSELKLINKIKRRFNLQ